MKKIEDLLNKIIQGDSVEILKQIPDESIDCMITSPPYFGLRHYLPKNHPDKKKEIGNEETPEEYVDRLMSVFTECKRVLKKSGTLWLNIGDTKEDKSFIGIPELLMFALKKESLYLRSKIIWFKPNAMPSSIKDAFTPKWEYIYFFTKSRKYWFDLNATREPHKQSSIERLKYPVAAFGGDPKNPMCKFGKGAKQGVNTIDLNHYLQNYPMGKNHGDVIRLSPKYLEGEGHTSRQGLNRQPDIVTIKAYKEYQQPIAKYLKKHILSKHKPILDECFGVYKWKHWTRSDFSGSSLPGVEDWFKLKEIIGFDDTFDDKIYEVEKTNIPIFQSGCNPGDFWNISTQGFRGAHYAVFPPALPERCIKAGCPSEVCKKCGKPRERIVETPHKGATHHGGKREGRGIDGNLDPEACVYMGKTIGWSDCGCGEGFVHGVVLDPFSGAGTTCVVAKQLGRNFIGIDINEEFCEMSRTRLRTVRFNEGMDKKDDIAKKIGLKNLEKIRGLDEYSIVF